MSKYEVIRKIAESTRINEYEQSYYIEMFAKGKYTEADLKWIWEY